MTDDIEMTLEADTSTSQRKRTITGKIVTFGDIGKGNGARTRFAPGVLDLPADLSRIKLLDGHDQRKAAIGYMVDYEETADAGIGTFYVPKSERGDIALQAAADGTRDGLSIGCGIDDYTYADGGSTLVAKHAKLHEVSLVTLAAFQNAKVLDVQYARGHNQGGNTMTDTNEAVELEADGNAHTAPRYEFSADQFDQLMAKFDQAPAQQITPPSDDNRNVGLSEVAAQFAAGYQDGKDPIQLAAALNDIVPSNDAGEGMIRPMWVDELWQASRVRRPFINAAGTPKPVTGLKIEGWKYDLENVPEVDEYAGDKAAISSNDIKTVPASGDVVRRAGGWDFDRAYIDLGSRNFVEATFQMATDDYLKKSEAYVRGILADAATAVTGGDTFADDLAILGSEAVAIGSELSLIAMSTDRWLDFAALTETEVPWWLRSQGELNLSTTSGSAGRLQFVADPNLDADTILAVDGRAYSYYEKQPIRAQALNIPNGGVDLGVFGYLGCLVHDPRAILKISNGS